MLILVLHLTLYIPNSFVIMRFFLVQSFGANVLELSPRSFVAVTLAMFAVPCLIMASIPQSELAGVFSFILDLTGPCPFADRSRMV